MQLLRAPRVSFVPAACTAVMLAIALMAAPIRARAADPSVGTEGIAKLVAFASCAIGIVLASDPASITGAAANCIKVLLDELKQDEPNP